MSRYKDSAILQPYCPYRFSRQFGYVQSIPDRLEQDARLSVRGRDLKSAFKYWRESVFPYSKSTLTIPSKSEAALPSVTQGYAKWWASVFDSPTGNVSTGLLSTGRLSLWSRRIRPAEDEAPITKRSRLASQEPVLGEPSTNPAAASPTCSRDRFWRTARSNIPSPDEAVDRGGATSSAQADFEEVCILFATFILTGL